MATLHDAVNSTKKIIFIFILIITVITVLYFLTTGIISYIQSQQAPPPPTEDFGDLPDSNFPPSATTNALSYDIDTVTGELPNDFPSRMDVYQIEQPEPDLNNLTDAKRRALGAGFATKELRMSDTVYQWTDLKTTSRTMKMDIVNGSFIYTTDFITNDSFLNATNFLTTSVAINEARDFFTNLNSFPSDVAEGETTTESFAVSAGKLIPASNEADTKAVVINFFQTPIVIDDKEYPIYYSKPNKSPINALVASFDFPSVVEAHYTYNAVSDNSGEYVIKSVEKAYQDLQEGKAYIASYFGTDTDIKIQDIFLAYYIGDGQQEYAIPIYVFRNKTKGFYAYVPAVDDYWNYPTPTPEEKE